MNTDTFIRPTWPAPATVAALLTTRRGGFSQPPFATMNMSLHVGDQEEAVLANRAILRRHLPAEPLWLQQVHGNKTIRSDDYVAGVEADAAVSYRPHQVCVVRTADCLPVLFCNRSGTRVGAAHAGWRGLVGGILESTLAALDIPPTETLVYLGACIGRDHFQVQADVRDAFIRANEDDDIAFTPDGRAHWYADLHLLAKRRLARLGIHHVYGEPHCTFCDREVLYSHRRDKPTGHMAALIWLKDTPLTNLHFDAS